MSDLLNKASLVMIPSGYKEDVVYSPVPTDGSGDLALTRASNGTRINSSGLVEDCPWNLAQYSEDFTNAAWIKTNATITSNATTAPNGTTTADKLIASAVSALHYVRQNITVSALSHTITFFAKPAEYNGVWVTLDGASNYANFTLSGNGSSTSTGSTIASIVKQGDYYLCTFTQTLAAGTAPVFIGVANPAGTLTFLGDGTSGVYIWGAQLNIGSTAKPYFPTTDRLNVPRLTYQNGGGGCPSLLLEKQSTNLALYSEQFDNAWWSKANGGVASAPVVTANAEISPDGTQNADRVVFTLNGGTASGDISQLESTAFVSASLTRTQSVYIKTTDNTTKVFTFVTPTGAVQAITVTGTYQRFTLTATGVAAGAIRLRLRGSSSGEGTATSASIAIWGMQYEDGSYATSYIPTTSASATRVADACSKTGISSLIGATNGAMFMEIDNSNPSAYLGTAPNNTIFGSINSGDYLNNFHFNTDATKLYVYCNASGGALQAAIGTNMPTTPRIKMAVTYTSSAIKFFVNGSLIGTDTSFTLPSSMSRVDVGHMGGQPDSQRMRGGVIAYLLFATALTDAEAISLTTL